MNARLKVALVLLLVFAGGALTGAAGTRALHHRRQAKMMQLGPEVHRREMLLGVLDRNLSLTPAQRRSIGQILDQHAFEAEQVISESEPRLRAIRRSSHDAIRKELRPEQLPEFERTILKMEERRGRRFGGKKHGPPRLPPGPE